MTRINVVPPKTLEDKFLIAEYREITRVFSLVRKAQEKGKRPSDFDIASHYRLGKGHVTFFYNKLDFVLNRYHLLITELLIRKYRLNPISDELLISGINQEWFGHYTPTPEAIEVNKERLRERRKLIKNL